MNAYFFKRHKILTILNTKFEIIKVRKLFEQRRFLMTKNIVKELCKDDSSVSVKRLI